MQIIINNHIFRYEIENISRMFFHDRITEIKTDAVPGSDDFILTEIENGNIYVSVSADKKNATRTEQIKSIDEKAIEWQMAGLLYDCLTEVTGKTQQWGLLTGVRPTRLVRRMLDEGKNIGEIREKFISLYRVSPEKFSMMWQTAMAQKPIIADRSPWDFSLYISIPFCPSRCNYCSFVSGAVSKYASIIPDYVELLSKEIEETSKIVKSAGLRLKSVYFGGGTPTTLSVSQLEALMGKINDCFDLSEIREYTVEAGRPDTVTKEKLLKIKRMGADRISINPQTFNDSVLMAIGRKHTVRQTLDAYEEANKIGFRAINMDLIAGLTGDTLDSFVNSVNTATELKPQNITVHTLTVKRASSIGESGRNVFQTGDGVAQEMVNKSQEILFSSGYFPYYLYRQKGTLSNLENVGYCTPSHEGYYNIYIMDEIHTIIALGAGAVTKLKAPHRDEIKRIYNYKYPTEYLSGFQNIIDRKREVLSFYELYSF